MSLRGCSFKLILAPFSSNKTWFMSIWNFLVVLFTSNSSNSDAWWLLKIMEASGARTRTPASRLFNKPRDRSSLIWRAKSNCFASVISRERHIKCNSLPTTCCIGAIESSNQWDKPSSNFREYWRPVEKPFFEASSIALRHISATSGGNISEKVLFKNILAGIANKSSRWEW